MGGWEKRDLPNHLLLESAHASSSYRQAAQGPHLFFPGRGDTPTGKGGVVLLGRWVGGWVGGWLRRRLVFRG